MYGMCSNLLMHVITIASLYGIINPASHFSVSLMYLRNCRPGHLATLLYIYIYIYMITKIVLIIEDVCYTLLCMIVNDNVKVSYHMTLLSTIP